MSFETQRPSKNPIITDTLPSDNPNISANTDNFTKSHEIKGNTVIHEYVFSMLWITEFLLFCDSEVVGTGGIVGVVGWYRGGSVKIDPFRRHFLRPKICFSKLRF
jgi:hypothetical protein